MKEEKPGISMLHTTMGISCYKEKTTACVKVCAGDTASNGDNLGIDKILVYGSLKGMMIPELVFNQKVILEGCESVYVSGAYPALIGDNLGKNPLLGQTRLVCQLYEGFVGEIVSRLDGYEGHPAFFERILVNATIGEYPDRGSVLAWIYRIPTLKKLREHIPSGGEIISTGLVDW